MGQLSAEQWSELVTCWTRAQPIVTAYVRAAVPDFHEAEDVVQEVVRVAAASFEKYDPSRSFVSWALGIARYRIIDHLRDKAKDRHVFNSEMLGQIAEAYEFVEPELDDMKEALSHCLGKAQGRSRKLLEMRYIRDMAPQDIAASLGISTNLVAVTLHRVRCALAKCIQTRLAEGGKP